MLEVEFIGRTHGLIIYVVEAARYVLICKNQKPTLCMFWMNGGKRRDLWKTVGVIDKEGATKSRC